jgi:hypothetical protein
MLRLIEEDFHYPLLQNVEHNLQIYFLINHQCTGKIPFLHRTTTSDDGHWASLLAAAKREGGQHPRSEERECREREGEREFSV